METKIYGVRPFLSGPSRDYKFLKKKYESDLKLESTLSRSLEQDIDEPIKNCVAMLALLGCQTIWCCCGFDYIGQPIHKYHQYGRTYFILSNTLGTKTLWGDFLNRGLLGNKTWEFYKVPNTTTWDLHVDFGNVVPQWRDPKSPHYSENAVMYIEQLERLLESMSDSFSDSAIVFDTNEAYQRTYRHWQYPIKKESWYITKEDFLARSHENR